MQFRMGGGGVGVVGCELLHKIHNQQGGKKVRNVWILDDLPSPDCALYYSSDTSTHYLKGQTSRQGALPLNKADSPLRWKTSKLLTSMEPQKCIILISMGK